VVAFKDSRGRLTIRNLDPEEKTGRAPPSGGASALLDPIILEAAQSNRLPVPLVQALIKVESNFVTWAVSPKGAMGLMQLMPGTASFLGVQDPFCPRQNILAGCRYLRLLLDCFNDSLPLALAAYNAGFQRVISAGFQVPQIKETQEFVTQVLGRYYASVKRARGPWI
jgi:soluble lytic murein transglycosylase-like protein